MSSWLVGGERRERARRRRLATLALGGLSRPVSAQELRVALGEDFAGALADAEEQGFAERRPDGTYAPTGRCRFEVGIVLAGTDEAVSVVSRLRALATTPERAALLAVVSDPLSEGLRASAEAASLGGPVGALARALLRAAEGEDSEERPDLTHPDARDTFAAAAAGAHVCARTRPEVALALLRWALGPDGFEGRLHPSQGFVAGVLTQVLYDLGDHEAAIAFSRKAQKALLDPDTTFSRLLLMSLEGHLLADLHRLNEARQVFTRVELLARSEGWLEFSGIARIAFGTIAFREGQTDASVELFKSALELLLGSSRYEVLAHHCLAHSWAKQGRHIEAQRALSDTLPLLDSVSIRLSAATNAIAYDTFMGDVPEARLKLDELQRTAPDSPHGRLSISLSRAYVSAAEAKWSEALGHAEAASADASSRPAFAVALGCLRASCLLHLGRAEEAARVLEDAARLHHLHALSRHRAMVQTLDAEIALALGDSDRVKRALRRAGEAGEALRTFDVDFRLKAVALKLAVRSGDLHAVDAARAAARAAWDSLTDGLDSQRRARFAAVADRPELLALIESGAHKPLVATLPWLRGSSPAFSTLVSQLERVAPSEFDVLLIGETGAGKELCARALHALSPRSSGPFVAINCAAMTDELLLSELFGHEKGAFTGAVDRHLGRFERADGGTLFLDEVGDISPRGQAALLRALQERTFERVGGSQPIRANVRVVAATNRDLASAVLAREFREDLYYRLRGIQLRVPPLRERADDVLVLARGFLIDAAQERGGAERTLSDDAERALLSHAWPGNVRELRSVIRAADLICEGPRISVALIEQLLERRAPAKSDANLYAQLKGTGQTLREFLEGVERQVILDCLEAHGGNLASAAAELGLSRSRLSQIVHADPVLRAHRRGTVA